MTERLPPLTLDEMSAEQKRVYERLAAGRARGVAGPLMAWLRSPKFAEFGQDFGGFCRRETTLPERLSELAILVTVAHWKSAFQWHGHEKLGLAAGLPRDAVMAIKSGETPAFQQDDEKAVFGFVSELLTSQGVSDGTFNAIAKHLDRQAMVELIGIVGYYVMGAMTVRAFGLAPGAEGDPFAA